MEKTANKRVLETLFKNRIEILIVSVLCAILAVGVTFFIPKKYTSSGIVFPTNSNSMKDVANSTFFGYEFQADRLIQMFQSQKMKETIVKRYDLINYYEIDTNSKNWRYSLSKNYNADISFKRTKFISVELSVTMKSPELACDIANTMMSYIDTIRKEILYENIYALQNDLSYKIAKNQPIVDSLLYLLSNEKKMAKPNQLAQNIVSKLEENNKNGNLGLGDEIVINAAKNNYTFKTAKAINEYYHQLSILSNLKKELVQLKEKTSMPFPRIYRVQNAIADYKKTSPSFLVNLILGFLIGAIVTILFYSLKIHWNNFSESVSDE
ncbi:Wzz/FepE/Etk N-terminal domain-containing protein [Flavobacteriales bacterium]|nr:Wzz/FepE/Etk N-terminal domain-containing protein [Flavobacteriales bacterium]MDC1370582.1 Wzz/FepE/Etk N-terminal domain-containing protein [Flavobacteriales bacterium]